MRYSVRGEVGQAATEFTGDYSQDDPQGNEVKRRRIISGSRATILLLAVLDVSLRLILELQRQARSQSGPCSSLNDDRHSHIKPVVGNPRAATQIRRRTVSDDPGPQWESQLPQPGMLCAIIQNAPMHASLKASFPGSNTTPS